MLFSSSSLVFSQQVDPATYNGSYDFKVGDSAQYVYSYVFFEGKDSTTSTVFYQNGSSSSYTLTKGVSISIEIAKINTTGGSESDILVNKSYSIPNSGTINTTMTPDTDYLIYPSFDSYAHAESYFNISSSHNGYNFSQESDFISFSTNISSPLGQLQLQNYYSINWKSGWLQYKDQKNLYPNGSLQGEFTFQSSLPDSQSTSTNTASLDPLFILSPIIFLAIIVRKKSF